MEFQIYKKLNANGEIVELSVVAERTKHKLHFGTAVYDGSADATIPEATQSASGLLSATDKKVLDSLKNLATSSVTGVKGGAEESYRTGQVEITKTNIGLGNVTNDAQVKRSEMGKAGGVATLGTDGKVPSAQLPSYVDDVEEYADKTKFPTQGESGKIYVAQDTNVTYRWSGTGYVEIGSSLALGETSSTAYAGDKGKKNADNIASLQTRMTAVEGKNTSQDTAITKAQETATAAQTTANNAVRYNAAQSLTDTQKAQARTNLGLGGLATKSAIASGDITDGTIVNADINANAAIAQSKIDGLPKSLTDLGDRITNLTYNDLKRINVKSYTGGGTTFWYYPIATLPVDNDGNYASVVITGRIGGWVKTNMSYINAVVSNRSGETGSFVDLGDNTSSALGITDIVLYRQTDNRTIVYLKCNAYFAFDINVQVMQATYTYNGSYTTAPTGTLKWSASTAANSLFVNVNGAYVKDKKLATEEFVTGKGYTTLALGETATTAYAGSKGKANADAIAALQTRAGNIESKNTTQDTDISELKTRMAAVETKNGTQDTAITNAQNAVTAAQTTANNAVRYNSEQSLTADQKKTGAKQHRRGYVQF